MGVRDGQGKMNQDQWAHQGLRCCARETRLHSLHRLQNAQKETYQYTIRSLVGKNTSQYFFTNFSSVQKSTAQIKQKII